MNQVSLIIAATDRKVRARISKLVKIQTDMTVKAEGDASASQVTSLLAQHQPDLLVLVPGPSEESDVRMLSASATIIHVHRW